MRRSHSQHLVSQYLENISGDALAEYQKIIREYVRRRSGVYALYRRNRLYYVGLASNLRNRLNQHLKDKHRGKWDRFSVYLTIGSDHLKERESLVLRIVQPKGNSQKGKFRRAENLRVRLGCDLRQLHREQLAEVLGKIQAKIERATALEDEHGRKPALAALVANIRAPRRLRAAFRGDVYRARVRPNGQIRYKGRTYNSPSLAGRAVTKRPTNGWWFWRFERAPGDWVRLRELRR
jgi:hypothetical protein